MLARRTLRQRAKNALKKKKTVAENHEESNNLPISENIINFLEGKEEAHQSDIEDVTENEEMVEEGHANKEDTKETKSSNTISSKKVAAKMNRFKKLEKIINEYEGKSDERGVIYVGHLPYGFVEKGIKEYFTQFGEVYNVKLFRSKKTGRSKGYAFVEFRYKEVAKIAAAAMKNYIMYGKTLVCHPIEELKSKIFKRSLRKFKYIPWNIIHKKKFNSEKTEAQKEKSVSKLLKKEQKKKKKLEKLGFKYPGYEGYITKQVEIFSKLGTIECRDPFNDD